MGLYAVHRILVVTACAGAVAFAAWCGWSLAHGAGAVTAAEGLIALSLPIDGYVYLRALKRKLASRRP